MTDPRSIEGSPERAEDRGREEDLGFTVSDRPSLGDPAVVSGLMSEFAASVVAVRKAYNEDKLSGDQAQQRVRELAREYGDVVMGRDRRYASMPWNDPSRLGRRIALAVPPIDGVVDPGELLFLTVGTGISELAAAQEDGRVSDDDTKAQADEMLSDAAALMLGWR